MILTDVKIHGFKSFAKKMELKFDGNITCVIGPNGCGKTNVVDAIRWGLGQQKTSILRTDRMENVIFGGAQSSKPLGMAEVSIAFDNSSHILPIDYNEVVITRRLYRSGESEYLINKNAVRLKDINDLIMDTGIGADAYSVIELKMIEDILSDKAEDRRKLLEEAAGVTKYKHRLRAAIRKLDATQNDLLRVNDIIQEVDRTVNSLRRQVQRAKRYQVLQDRARDLELKSSRQLLDRYQQQITPLKETLKALHQQKEGSTTEISKEEADLETLNLKLAQTEKVLMEYRESLNETVERIHRREGDIRVSKEQIISLTDRIQRAKAEIVNLKKRREEQENHLGVTRNERESYQVKITSTGRIFNNKKKELDVFLQGLNLKRLDLNGKKKEIIECLEEINRLGNEETQYRAKIDNAQGRLERLDEEDEVCRRALKSVHDGKKELDGSLDKLRSRKKKIDQSVTRYTHELENLRDEMDQARERYFSDKSELEVQQGRLSFLHTVMENREGLTDGGKRLIEHKARGLMGVLADVLDTAPEHRRAVEAGLGEAARYLLFEETVHAFDALDLLKKRGGGRVSLISLDRIKGAKPADRPSFSGERGVVGWGDEIVDCDSPVQSVVHHLLGDLLVVSDLDAAQSILDKEKTDWIRIATLDGNLVTGWGAVHATDPEGGDDGMVGRKQRIEELEKKIAQLARRMADAEKQKTADEARRAALLKKREEAEKDGLVLQGDLNDMTKKQDKRQFEKERAEEGLRNNVDERQKLLSEIEKGKEYLENIRPRMEKLLETREAVETVSGQIQAEVEKLEEEERVMEEEVHRLNLSVVRLKGEAKNLDYEIERSQNLIRDIKNTIEQREEEIEMAQETIVEKEQQKTANEKQLVEDFADKENREKRLHQQDEIYQAMKEELEVKTREVRQVRKSREEASEKIHHLEMKIADLAHQTKSLVERIRESYDMELEALDLPEEPINIPEAEAEVSDLKRKMRGLGAVNLMALEEFDKEEERLNFLTQQREDLENAKATLQETIKKINQTARQRFSDVFLLVQKNFRETFKRFFQGGEADLRLPADEDPLEAQIEIVARPKGKHFRDLTLLSGGERALTAISLLFALYLVKPSPFCILDEVDAPLDDANVERFTRVLAEFAQNTQFIIVTHNKMTMKAANTLFGVTMEEEGVSKIVSVKFEDMELNQGKRNTVLDAMAS